MPLHEISAVEADARELRIGQPTANVGHHCIQNRGVAEIAPIVRGQQRDTGPPSVNVLGGPFGVGR